MLDLLEAIRDIIEKHVIGRVPISPNPSAGDTTLTVQTSRRFCVDDTIVIYSKPDSTEPALAEKRIITSLPNTTTIIIDEPLAQSYQTAAVERCLYGQFLDGIYVGNPSTLPKYPSITISADSKDNEWLTIGEMGETFSLDITVYASETDFQNQYKLMLRYAKIIEDSLFRNLFPLVPPYATQTLAEDLLRDDTVYRATADSPVIGAWAQIFFESADHLRMTRVKQYLGNQVYELQMSPGVDFPANETTVIIPLRYFYKAYSQGISYGEAEDNGAMLKSAVIHYEATEEVIRVVTPSPMTY